MDEIVVTNWEKVDKDDFYLSDRWAEEEGKDRVKEARKLQKEGNLYLAYTVPAVNFAIYRQMDAHQIFINADGDEVLFCESAIIDRDFKERWQREL